MDIEKEITFLKQRNERVEANKAWETSAFRTVIIALLIYVVVSVVFYVTNVSRPLISAIIPPIGYIFSMQSLPFVKHWWIKNIFKR